MARSEDPVAALNEMKAALEKAKPKIGKARTKAQKLHDESEEELQLCNALEEEEELIQASISSQLNQARRAMSGGFRPDTKLAGKVDGWVKKVSRLKA